MADGLTVLADGTIRYGDLEGGAYIEFPRSSWSGSASKVQGQIQTWLTQNKLSGWVVTVASTGPNPDVSISAAPVRMN